MHKLKLRLSDDGFGSVSLDDMEIKTITEIRIVARAGKFTEVNFTIMADIDADLEVRLENLMIEKERLIGDGSPGAS